MRSNGSPRWFNRYGLSIGLLVVGLLTTIVVVAAVAGRASDKTRLDRAQELQLLRSDIERRVETEREVMHALAALQFTTASGRADFSDFIEGNGILRRSPGVQAVSWSPRVAREERDAFEASVRSEQALQTGAESDFMVRTNESSEDMVVVTMIEPFEGNEQAFGFDLASDVDRAIAIDRAQSTRDVVATAPITLVQEQGDSLGLLLLLAVFNRDPTSSAPDSFAGVVSAVHRAEDLFETAQQESNMEYSVSDSGPAGAAEADASSEPVILYSTDASLAPSDASVTFDVAGRAWTVALAEATVPTTSATGALLAGVLGLLLTALITAFGANVAGRAVRAENMAARLDLEVAAQRRELETNADRSSTIVAAAEVGLWERNLTKQTGWVSDAFLSMLGYPTDTERSRVGLDYIHPDDLARVGQRFAPAMDEMPNEPIEFEFRLRHIDGNYRHVQGRALVVERDGDRIAIGAHLDVTDHRERDKEIRLMLVRLEDASAASHVALWEWEPDTARYWTSDNFSEVHGVEAHRWMTGWSDIVEMTDEGRAVLEELRAREPSAEISEHTWRVPLGDGSYRSILSRSRVVEREGQRLLMGANLDVSADRARSDQLAQLNSELKDSNQRMAEFSRVASHDLRSPLRAINSLVDFIREDGGDRVEGVVGGHLQRIAERVRLMDELLDDLLEYSRSGTDTDTPSLIDPASIVADVLATIETAPGLESIVLCETGPVLVEATPLAICLRNLVDNAHKHHGRDSGRVVVSVGESDGYLEIDVTDDGVGIEPEYHNQVFEPFRSLAPRTGKTPGTGIGLSVIRRTVEARGGTIGLESTPGQGSAFRLRWPVADGEGRPDSIPKVGY